MAADPQGDGSQIVAYTGTSAQSSALTRGGAYIVTATTAAWIATGANPTAVAGATGSMLVAPNFPTPITVARDGWKVAVIRDSVSGSLTIAPGGD